MGSFSLGTVSSTYNQSLSKALGLVLSGYDGWECSPGSHLWTGRVLGPGNARGCSPRMPAGHCRMEYHQCCNLGKSKLCVPCEGHVETQQKNEPLRHSCELLKQVTGGIGKLAEWLLITKNNYHVLGNY